MPGSLTAAIMPGMHWTASRDYTQYEVAKAGANVGLLRSFGEVMPATMVIYKGKLYKEGFELLGGDPHQRDHECPG